MPDDLYEHDVLAWSEQQAALLHRLASGERVNQAVDWDNVIEEVQDLGRSELHTVESYLEQAMRHLLKVRVFPNHLSAPHWRGEIVSFLAGAQRRYSPSMRQRINLDDIFRIASRAVQEAYIDANVSAIGVRSPWTLDQLLMPDFDIHTLMECVGPDGCFGAAQAKTGQ